MNRTYQNTPNEILVRSLKKSVFTIFLVMPVVMLIRDDYWMFALPIYLFLTLIEIILNNQVVEVDNEEIRLSRFHHIYRRIPMNARTIDAHFINKTVPVLVLIDSNSLIVTAQDYSIKTSKIKLSNENFSSLFALIKTYRQEDEPIETPLPSPTANFETGEVIPATMYTTNKDKYIQKNRYTVRLLLLSFVVFILISLILHLLDYPIIGFSNALFIIILISCGFVVVLLCAIPLLLYKRRVLKRKVPYQVSISSQVITIDGIEFECSKIKSLQLSSPTTRISHHRTMVLEYENKFYTYYFGSSAQYKLFEKYSVMCNQLSNIFGNLCEYTNATY